jgi:hypothetical protein
LLVNIYFLIYSYNPTERLFKSGYGSEWSYTNGLIRFPYNLAVVTRSTVLGYVSSFIWPVEIGQYHVGAFVNAQVFSHWGYMGQAHNCFPVLFRYHYLADQFPFILQSRIWWSPFSHKYFVFHEIGNMNMLCSLYWKWPRTR